MTYTRQLAKGLGWQKALLEKSLHLAEQAATKELSGGFMEVNPNKLHSGTRTNSYRCSLPGLAEFTVCRCEGTHWGHHKMLRMAQAADYDQCHTEAQLKPLQIYCYWVKIQTVTDFC